MTDTKKAGFFSVGLVRGLIYMLAGYVAGILLVTVIRLVMGLPAIVAWNPPATSTSSPNPPGW